MKKWIVVSLSVIGFLGVALAQARFVNSDVRTHDQDQYLRYAIAQADSGYAAIGNRIQMPLYPSLLSRFVTSGTPEANFGSAKWIAIAIAAIATVLVWALLLETIERTRAIAIGVVYTLFVAAFRAAYVQCEPLFYALFFAAFLAQVRVFQRENEGVLAGGIAGVAWLTKASMLLGSEIFLAVIVVRAIACAIRKRFRESLVDLGNACAFVIAFALVVFPYARESKSCCGDYLYNMNTKYVVWCDSWDSFLALLGPLGHPPGWHALDPALVPSMGNYLRAHSIGSIVMREISGIGLVLANTIVGSGYQLFVLAWIGIAIAMRPQIWRRPLAQLVVPWLSLQFLAYGFYAPIVAGNRFSLTLFLPGSWALFRALPFETVAKKSTTIALVLAAIALPILAPLLYSGR